MEACGLRFRGRQNPRHSRLSLKPQAKPPVGDLFPTNYVWSTMVAAFPSQSLKDPGSTYHIPPLSQLLETVQLTLAIKIIYLKKLAFKTTLIWQWATSAYFGNCPPKQSSGFCHKLTRKPEQANWASSTHTYWQQRRALCEAYKSWQVRKDSWNEWRRSLFWRKK